MRTKLVHALERNMVYKLRITETTCSQLDEIAFYVAVRLSNPSAASLILSDFDNAVDSLINDGAFDAYVADEELRKRGYRKRLFHKNKYLIVYLVQGEWLKIVGVFHTSQNYIDHL